MIDLAGSEGATKAKTEGQRLKEGANINKSLLALTSVISKLASKENIHINYRDSKLTRFLQPFLGGKYVYFLYFLGNAKTMVVCTINPTMQNHQESANTVQFARSAGTIKNTVKVNEISEFEYSNKKENERKDFLIAELENENNDLKEELTQFKVDTEARIQALETELDEALQKNRVLNEEKISISRELKSEKSRIETLEADYERSRCEHSDLVQLLNEMEEKISSFETERKSLQLIKDEYERKLADLRYEVRETKK